MARKGLGRGLGSLIGEASAEYGESAPDNVVMLSKITPNPNQPRKDFNEESLAELTESIRENGVLQPILVRRRGDSYEIVAGERRYQAAKRAGLTEMPVIIREVSDEEVFQLALIENLQRSDLNPMEEALGYRKLLDEKALTQEQLAQALSKSRPAIANTLRLLDLPEKIQTWVAEGKISQGHARAVLSVKNEEDRVRLAQKVMLDGLSVRQTEQLAPLFSGGTEEKPARVPSPKSFKRVARQLRNRLQASVSVRQVRGKNKIEIGFKDEDDLARIASMILGIKQEG